MTEIKRYHLTPAKSVQLTLQAENGGQETSVPYYMCSAGEIIQQRDDQRVCKLSFVNIKAVFA